VLPRGLRVGAVTGSQGAYRVRPHAELSTLDVVSVLIFDTPALTSTDPPVIPVERALSATPEATQQPPPVPTASVAPLPEGAPILHAGAADGVPPTEGVAQAEQ
jgi:hypothetical protein